MVFDCISDDSEIRANIRIFINSSELELWEEWIFNLLNKMNYQTTLGQMKHFFQPKMDF